MLSNYYFYIQYCVMRNRPVLRLQLASYRLSLHKCVAQYKW